MSKSRIMLSALFASVVLLLAGCGRFPRPASAPTPAPVAATASPWTPAPTAAPTPTPAPAPTPTPAPVPTPSPVPVPTPETTVKPQTSYVPQVTRPPAGYPVITRSPTSEWVYIEGSCWAEARSTGDAQAVWYFVSPDHVDYRYDEINTVFPELIVRGGGSGSMQILNIPYEFDGWLVYCHFYNGTGTADSRLAEIRVYPDWTPTPEPTPERKPVPAADSWVVAASLEEAIRLSGVFFNPPVEASLPAGFSASGYRAAEDVLEADYYSADSGEGLVIRVSNERSVFELIADYTPYTGLWTLDIEGLTIYCRGDGERVNVAVFSGAGRNWAILCNSGEEGRGLLAEQIRSIIKGMQGA